MFGNCQKPVFSLGVSHHNNKITCENLGSIGHFPTMFYIINSSPMLVNTKSVFKSIFVLSNYQTCTFPLSRALWHTYKFREIYRKQIRLVRCREISRMCFTSDDSALLVFVSFAQVR